jgi:hypothetical protein
MLSVNSSNVWVITRRFFADDEMQMTNVLTGVATDDIESDPDSLKMRIRSIARHVSKKS